MRSRIIVLLIAAMASLLLVAPEGGAVHFYRNDGSGCSQAASNDLTDDAGESGPIAAVVDLGHNTFHDHSTLAPVTRVAVGEAVQWRWASLHCHSVRGSDGSFYSGYHYPAQMGSLLVAQGFFDYPVPELVPELTYTHTFTEPGVFMYECEHHAAIGMVGVVIVE